MFIHIPAKDLFVSEPDPRYFGNPKNDDPKVNWLKSRFHFSFAGINYNYFKNIVIHQINNLEY